MQDERPLIDTGLVPDIYCDGIGAVEHLGACFRAVYFTYSTSPLSGIAERVVVARIVRPMASLEIGLISRMLRQKPIVDTRLLMRQ